MSSNPPIDRNLPQFELDQVKALVNELYDLDGDYQELVSERDRTWIVTTTAGDRSVLKISNVSEPEGIVDLQIRMMGHVLERDADFPIPSMVFTETGLPYEWITSNITGHRHMIRMISFMPGITMDELPEARQTAYFYNTGALLGRLAIALQGFSHPFSNRNEHLWDLSRCQQLRGMVSGLPDAGDRRLCTEILDRARDVTLPAMRSLRSQLVHQDAHGGNVMVDPVNPALPVALLDFGDTGDNPVVCEIAVAAEAVQGDEADPLWALTEAAKGFNSKFPLQAAEVDLLYDAYLLRMTIGSIVIGYRAIYDSEDLQHVADDTYRVMMHRLYQLDRNETIKRIQGAIEKPV